MHDPLDAGPARVARRPAGSGRSSTPPRRTSSPSRPSTPRSRVGGTRQGAGRGRPRPRRAGARFGRGRPRLLARRRRTSSSPSSRLGVLGRLELALGNLEAAGGYLRDAPGRLLAGGLNDPTQPVWADAIETLIALGELEQARDVPGAVRAARAAARQPVGAGRRCALPRPARGRGGRSRRRFRRVRARSSPTLDGHPYPLERGRTLLCLGIGAPAGAAEDGLLARRSSRRSRSSRSSAPRLWAEKARAELTRISGRRPASEELTETEHRVAELAAQGRIQQGDRRRAVHGREHGRGPPLARLPQARHPLAHGARGRVTAGDAMQHVDEAAQT